MKKTSIALMIGLFAVGCGESAPKKTATTAPPMDPGKMAAHMGGPPGAAHAAGEDKKDEETKAEGEKAPAADSTEAPK